jgi:dCMP deaminase
MNSYAVRSQVGALIVKDNNVLSYGYNGTPAGFDNQCELKDGTTKSIVIHAEANAICKLARTGSRGADGSTLYLTHSPCIECAKMIVQSGIVRVVYLEEYRKNEGLLLLQEAGIDTLHYQ